MDYSYLNNIELDQALEAYLKEVGRASPGPVAEEIDVTASLGRITSEAVHARISSPHYNACAMDGIALNARITFGATETTPVLLKEGRDFMRVDTGDPLPDEYDSVVMIEDVINTNDNMDDNTGNGTVRLNGAAVPWQNVRQVGEDICANEMILTAYAKIGPAAIGALLAGGVLKVKVWKKPVVGLIPTGDEIVLPTESPRKGDIIEFNTSIFSAMLKGWNAEAKVYGIVPDDFGLIREALSRACSECDLVILNAGSSAGREDFSRDIIKELGRVAVHGIAIRPGKPTILGIVGSRPVIGVPGYPVSGIMVMERLVKPVLSLYSGEAVLPEKRVKAVLTRKLVSSLKYREFVRVKLGRVDGRLAATPLNRGAGVVTSFLKADGILEIPMNSEGYESGTQLEVQLLKPEAEIDNTLVATGSHDPLLDTIADIFRRRYRDEYLASSHVGSMGGIMAIKRREAHIAGIHLLDEETGEYNTGYIRKYLNGERIALIKCVRRQQGLMTAPGNPENVKGLEDIYKKGLKYVNRQKGAGTRILLDYMLRKAGIPASGIYGYEREEFTHLSVAAQIASGSADAGLGIFSAARIYGLYFVPVCEEQYDFIAPEAYLELELVKHLLEILDSQEFKQALMELGGYNAEASGTISII